ncbi:MAG: ribonuclease HII [Candidatus Latescibacteria bacterium]|nr:ribonuclease HII [Candidatus Latescibacterota bacterium]
MQDSTFQKMTVSDIKDAIENISPPQEKTIQALEKDSRTSVQQLAKRIRRQQKALAQEEARLEKMSALENKLRSRGFTHIAGVDEAGRGPLAGPVVAAATILPPDIQIEGLNDSKKLSEKKREVLFGQIQTQALAIGVGQATPQEIDQLNIRNATHLAMRRALDQLSIAPDRVLIDGNAVPESDYNEMAIIGGDRKSVSIAAASIIAKVTRDRIMVKYDIEYPEYGLAKHKGYGSAHHLKVLKEHGATPIHRSSFAGVPNNTTLSEVGEVFADGIAAARNLEELTTIGDTIARASLDVHGSEMGILRELYRKRRTTLQRPGNMGERLATEYLQRKGFAICENNYRAAGGEIDIIAQKDGKLIFLEVKTATQTQFGDPKTWVTPQKQSQIIRVAKAYQSLHPKPNMTPRFDVISIVLSQAPPQIEHTQNAFTLSLKP